MINNGFFVKKPLTASEHFDEKTQQHNELHIYKTFWWTCVRSFEGVLMTLITLNKWIYFQTR